MLSQTGTYALQAVLALALKGTREPTPARVLAEELDIPANYLSKVLQRMAREGLLESTRGARGGFRLAEDPDAMTVAAVVAPFQEIRSPRVCLMGGACDPIRPCPAHARRAAWNAVVLEMLRSTTVADLLAAPDADESSSFLRFLPREDIA